MRDEPEQVVLSIQKLDRDTAYTYAATLSELMEPAAEAVSIFEAGAKWRIDAYFSGREAGETALIQLRALHDANVDDSSIAPIEQENWVALSQAALPPVHAGRFTICGSHDLHRVPNGPNTIIVEAGEAFGTAHHATTYGCLMALDRLTRRTSFRNVLDLGTGSGILALALHKALPHARILASDIDARSVEVAQENAVRNGLGRRAGGPTYLTADGLGDSRIQSRAPYDLIVANILAGPLIALAPQIADSLGKKGTLVLSGILVDQAKELCARYGALGLDLTRHERNHGWSTLVFRMRHKSRKGRHRPPDRYNLFMPTYD